jgi:hypothetical protein
VGQAILERQAKLGVVAEGALMIPIRPNGRLFGMLEMGRPTPFRASELAAAEALVEALVETIERGR